MSEQMSEPLWLLAFRSRVLCARDVGRASIIESTACLADVLDHINTLTQQHAALVVERDGLRDDAEKWRYMIKHAIDVSSHFDDVCVTIDDVEARGIIKCDIGNDMAPDTPHPATPLPLATVVERDNALAGAADNSDWAGMAEMQMREAEAQLATVTAERDREEAACSQVMEERDRAIKMCDELSYAIVGLTGGDDVIAAIGEHSNCNDPWENALELAENWEPPVAQPSATPLPLATVDEAMVERIRDAIAETLGQSAYDCTRVWHAWSCGTMTERDFELIVDSEDRLTELVNAVRAALTEPTP